MGKQWRHPAGKRLGFTWTPSWPGQALTMCPAVLHLSGAAAEDGCTTAPVSSCSPDGTGLVVLRGRGSWAHGSACANVSNDGEGLDELAVGTCSSPVPCWNSLNRPLVVVVSMGGALEPQDDGREGAPSVRFNAS